MPTDTSPIDPEAVLSELERVLASAPFRRADRSSTMLRFLVERALDGSADGLKEYTVGVEGLGRGPAFDPRTDAIVRAEASRLRNRLDRYYSAEGRADPVVIELPKGVYTPRFHRQIVDGKNEINVPLSTTPRSRVRPIVWIVFAAATIVAAFAAGAWMVRASTQPPGQPLVRLDVQLQSSGILGSEVGTDVVISPDASRVVFVATDSTGVARLRTRRLDGSPAIDLAGTEGARGPFFSPDGRWIGFWAAGQLRKIAIDGGSPVVVTSATDLLGASWGEDGTIVAALNSTGTLWRVSAAGGAPTPLLDLSAEKRAPRWPQILPGGEYVLYTALAGFGADRANIEVARLRDGKRRVVLTGGTYGRYVSPGYLTYVNQGTLYAVPFDAGRLATRGAGVPIFDDVAYSAAFGFAQMDISQGGAAVYRRSPGNGRLVVATLDSAAHATRLIDMPGRYFWPAVSPDGTKLALSTVESGSPSISIFENLNGGSPRIVSRIEGYSAAVWSPSGRELIVSGSPGLARVPASGGVPHVIFDGTTVRVPWSFYPDGRRLAIYAMNPTTAFDLWSIALDDSGSAQPLESQPLLATPFYEVYPSISPDGRWLAYSSNESGAWEVYVRALPDDGTKVQVSRGGGRVPRWARVGRTLFYATDDQRLMAISWTSPGRQFVPSTPRLWTAVLLANTGVLSNFDVTPDGRRIIAVVPAASDAEVQNENHVTLVLNLIDELRRRTVRP